MTSGESAHGTTERVQVAGNRRRFLSLDDLDVMDTARRDPDALLGGSQPVTVDEVQRESDLLLVEGAVTTGTCPPCGEWPKTTAGTRRERPGVVFLASVVSIAPFEHR